MGDAGPGAQLFFPNHGTVNILIVFVQHLDDTFEDCHDTTQLDEDGVPIQIDPNICYQGPDIPTATSWTDDEATEWPVYWSQEPDRRLPIWAENGFIASPDTDPLLFPEGSLSEYYDVMSDGELTITGYVYPEVYIPQQNRDWYHSNNAPFANGDIKRSHEILTHVKNNPMGIVFDGRFDNYTNGTNNVGLGFEDGFFDMIILAYRSGGRLHHSDQRPLIPGTMDSTLTRFSSVA